MIRANLIPPETRGTMVFGYRLEIQDLWRAAAVIGIAATFALPLLLIFNAIILKLDGDLAGVNGRLAQLATQTNDVGALSSNTRRLEEIDREAAWLQRSGQVAAIRLAILGNAVPQGVWLEHLGQDASGWMIDGDGNSLDAVSHFLTGFSQVSPGLQTGFMSVADNNRGSESVYAFRATISKPSPSPGPVASK